MSNHTALNSERRSTWTWADIPGVLLGLVRAATVTAGAIQLRGGQHWVVFAALGVGVAMLALVIERQLTDRLNHPIRPEQSLAGLLVCWTVVLAVATSLNAITAFSFIAKDIGRRENDRQFAKYWQAESGKLRDWLTTSRTTLGHAVADKQKEVDAAQAGIAQARRAKQTYTSDRLLALRRELGVLRELANRSAAVPSPSITAPANQTSAIEALGDAAKAITDTYIRSVITVPSITTPPTPSAFEPPVTDLSTLFLNETVRWTEDAKVGWIVALLIEALSFVALWRGGRRVPLATRVRAWKARIQDLKAALGSSEPATALQVRLEPMGLSGTIFLRVGNDFTVSDCLPRIEETLANHQAITGYRINRLSTSDGATIDPKTPLLPQLAGQPLIAVMEES